MGEQGSNESADNREYQQKARVHPADTAAEFDMNVPLIPQTCVVERLRAARPYLLLPVPFT
jgi:hypothetical protein